MNPIALALGVVGLVMAVRQTRAAYGLNDLDGWPYCKREASKATKLALAAWMFVVSLLAMVVGSFG